MFGSEILDVAIGLILVFLLLSLICSSAREAIETMLKSRAAGLERGISEMLGDRGRQDLVPRFYQHPLIKSLFHGDYKPGKTSNLPSYIPAQAFALAVMDLVKSAAPDVAGIAPAIPQTTTDSARTAAEFKQAVTLMPETSQLRGALLPLMEVAGDDAKLARQSIENWYNAAMDRVSGWYKRQTQLIIAAIGFSIAAFMNVDAIAITRYLNTNQTERSVLTEHARRITEGQPSSSDDVLGFLERQGGLPLGWAVRRQPFQSESDFRRDWRRPPDTPYGWLLKTGGILFTVFAVALGAPFWFDVLNRFMVIRSTVKPNEKSSEEKSKD